MKKKVIFALFFMFLVFSLVFFTSGCKKEEVTEQSIEQTAQEIDQLVNEIEQLDINIDLGNETLSEESSLI